MVFENYTAIKLPCNYATLVFVNENAFRINTTVVAIFNLFASLPTIVLNSLVLMAMYKKSSLCKCNNKILSSLALSDFLSGLLVQTTISAILLISNVKTPLDVPCTLLVFTSCVGYILACVSLLTVSLVSWERYTAIFHPYLYNRHVSSRFLFVMCTFVWSISIAVIFLLYFLGKHEAFFWTNAVLITFSYVWNIYVYIQIMRQVNKIQKEMQKRSERLGAGKNTAANHSKGMRLAASVILILLTSYFPQIILSIWRMMPDYPLFVDGYLEYWSMTIGPFASCLNPWVYCYYNSEIRKEVLKILFACLPVQRRNTKNKDENKLKYTVKSLKTTTMFHSEHDEIPSSDSTRTRLETLTNNNIDSKVFVLP